MALRRELDLQYRRLERDVSLRAQFDRVQAIIVYGDHARNAVRAKYGYDDVGIFPARPVEVETSPPSLRVPGAPGAVEADRAID